MFESFLGTDLGYLPGPRLAGRVPGDWAQDARLPTGQHHTV